jgi:hypothetical protein
LENNTTPVKRKKRKWPLIVFIMLIILFLFWCLDDEEYEEYEECEECEDYTEYSQDCTGDDCNTQYDYNDTACVNCGEDGLYPDDGEYDTAVDEDSAGSYFSGASRFGSSGKLEGRIAVVTILTDDATCSWDLDSQQDISTYNSLYNSVKIACNFITGECARYGRNVEFVWDWDAHPELIYNTSVSTSVPGDMGGAYDEVSDFIIANVDSEGIMNSLGANGIIYLACVDTPNSTNVTSATFIWERDYPYNEIEMCMMLMHVEDWLEAPSCFAHEILHTFGAADLYIPGMYGITQEHVNIMESSGLNDVMLFNEDPASGVYVYDRVPNEITDITAYYVGLINDSETVNRFGLQPSDYVAAYRR